MTLAETDIAGVFLIAPDAVVDHRGTFFKLYDESDLIDAGIDSHVSQARVALNKEALTLRGLHYQVEPYGETKIVRCTAGTVFDVVIDLADDSATRHQWLSFELSAINRLSVVVPPWCAHGYLTLTDDAELSYLMSTPHMPSAERGIRYDDPTLAVAWPHPPRLISDRDASLPLLADYGLEDSRP